MVSKARLVTDLDDMWLLHKLKKSEVEDVGCRSEIEDGRTPRDDCYSPYTGKSKYSLRIVKEAVYAVVRE